MILFFDWLAEIEKPIREELDVFDPSDLESWDEIDDYLRRGRTGGGGEEEVNILLKYLCCVIWRLHIQIHTLFAVGPQQKKEIRHFRNRLVR